MPVSFSLVAFVAFVAFVDFVETAHARHSQIGLAMRSLKRSLAFVD